YLCGLSTDLGRRNLVPVRGFLYGHGATGEVLKAKPYRELRRFARRCGRAFLARRRWSSACRTRVLITACRLIFNSFAASSSSSSIGDVKSTFTRRIGSILRPEFVKNRETSSPRSASSAIASADTAFRCL